MNKRQQRTYQYLTAHYLTGREAGEFSVLTRGINDPTLKLIIRDRAIRRNRFELIAAHKFADGIWTREMIERKWVQNLARMYRSRHWIVQYGAVGQQQEMKKGDPNPWALFRHFEKITPTSRGVSPWQSRKYPGKSHLERGLILVQSLEKGARKATQTQLRFWIGQKQNAISKARGQRKAQLRIELGRLERLLEGAT